MQTSNLLDRMYQYFNAEKMTRNYSALKFKKQKAVYISFQTMGDYVFGAEIDFHFQNDPELDNSEIVAIEVLTNAELANTPIEPAQDLPGLAEIGQAYLSIKNTDEQTLTETPLISLHRATNSGKFYFCNFNNLSWQACKVRFTGSPALGASNALMFNVYYNPK